MHKKSKNKAKIKLHSPVYKKKKKKKQNRAFICVYILIRIRDFLVGNGDHEGVPLLSQECGEKYSEAFLQVRLIKCGEKMN